MAKEKSTAESAAKVADKVAAETDPVMYVGPTIAGICIQNTVYTEIPDAAKKAMDDCPSLIHLFIPVIEYPKANIQIRERNGRISRAYERALKYKENRTGGR